MMSQSCSFDAWVKRLKTICSGSPSKVRIGSCSPGPSARKSQAGGNLETAVRPKKANFGSLSSVTHWTAVLCLLLLGLVAAPQAVHYHPNELKNDARHCTICVVAHASAQTGPVAPLFVSLATSAFVVHSDDADPKPVPDT